jgi:phosphinothricin acetyltransferase
VESRVSWFQQFGLTGRYRLLAAEENGVVVGYAGTTRSRPKAAYETTVETTVYCCPNHTGKGIGNKLYTALFAAVAGEDIRRIVAGYALPNPASAALHQRLDLNSLGFLPKMGGSLDDIGTSHGRNGP